MENNFDNNLDTINSNLLDDNFSNAVGSCGLPPVCSRTKIVKGSRRSCKTVGVGRFKKEVCVNLPTVKTVTNQACVDSKSRYETCAKENRKKLAEKIKTKVKTVKEKVKTKTDKAKTNIKKKTEKTRANIKKRVTKLKDKVGKLGKNFRNKFRSVMRKGILFNIKNNIHGTASRLYPAVASDNEVASKKYKKSFVGKSRNMYSQVVKQWESLGGKESDLKNAIRSGSSKRFLKAPYKSANGDDSMALYLHHIPSNIVAWENPNTTFYWGANGESEVDDESLLQGQEGVYNEETGEEEVISQEEEVKGIRAFFAWLKGLFSRNKADGENPYAEGTPEYEQYMAELNGDAGNEPDPSEANDSDIEDLLGKGQEDGVGTEEDEFAGEDDEEGDSETILGMEKNTAIGVGIGVVALLAIGGYFLYKKYGKK